MWTNLFYLIPFFWVTAFENSLIHFFFHFINCTHFNLFHFLLRRFSEFKRDWTKTIFNRKETCLSNLIHTFLPGRVVEDEASSKRKKSARFARTFSSRASRAARKNERAWGAQPNGRRASRSDVYELRATRSVLRAS